jgi:peptidoglycan/xylan/chitin deacetylase (PgdA/CDA1 family)
MSTPDHRTREAPAVGALAGAAMASYLGVALVGPWPARFPRSPAPIWPALRRSLGVEDCTASGSGYALTFDDGPHAQGTPAVLEILAGADALAGADPGLGLGRPTGQDVELGSRGGAGPETGPGVRGPGVRATFFLVGEQVRRNPALAREILAAGHGIGLHCDRHRNLLRLTPWQVREDIARALASIEDATGLSPNLYRPPYGVLNASALRLARARGWRTLLWTQWGRDWEARATAASIAARVTDGAEEGSVLLLHDADDYSAAGSWRRTVEALPRVLDVLAERGLRPAAP